MVRRAAFAAVVTCGAIGLAVACSTFSSSDESTPDAAVEGGGDGTPPPAPPPPGSEDAGAPIACDAGLPDIVSVARAGAPIDHIATDGLFAYWRTQNGHIARARLDDAGAPQFILDDAGAAGPIALTANDVYFLYGNELQFVPKAGGVAPSSIVYGFGSTIATSADHAYVGLVGGIRWAVEGATVATDIRGSLDLPTAITVANDVLAYLVAERDAGGKIGLYAGPASTYALTDPLLADDTGGTTLLAGDGTRFFWAKDTSVWTVAFDAGPPEVLVDEAQPIGALVADERSVVYSTAAGVKLFDRTHRCFAVVTMDPTPALALTPTDVFFVRGASELVRARR